MPAARLRTTSLEDTTDSLRQRGVRLTRQRKILLDLIDSSGEHLDAEQLYQLAKEKDPKLNRVTVYRTLKLLKTGGLVDELDLMHHKGDQHYYDSQFGFEILLARTEVGGYCAHCQIQREREMAEAAKGR